MAATPTTEPTEIIAGDTLKFRREDLSADYPASAWTLTYNLRGPSQINLTANADDDYFEVSVTAAGTADYKPGKYWWAAFVTKSPERYQVDSGTLEIKQDFASKVEGFDGRTHVKRTLDAVEAVIEGRATRAQMALTMGGKAVSMWSPEQLLAFRARYRGYYQAELDAEKIKNKKPTDRTIKVRFKSAS